MPERARGRAARDAGAAVLRRLARGAASGAMFAYFGVGGAVMSWWTLPRALRGLAPHDARRRARSLVAQGFRRFHGHMRALRILDHDPDALDLGDLPSPCVIVANHPTLIDTPALGAALPEVCFVVRHDVYASALFGPLLRACGHIDAGQGAGLADNAVVREAAARLAEGASLLIFPEGTRSPPGGLRRLRRGAFEVACRARVPVVALLLRCDPPMLHRGVAWYDIPDEAARYTVTRLATVHPDEVQGDARALARRLEELYRSRIAAWHEAP